MSAKWSLPVLVGLTTDFQSLAKTAFGGATGFQGIAKTGFWIATALSGDCKNDGILVWAVLFLCLREEAKPT